MPQKKKTNKTNKYIHLKLNPSFLEKYAFSFLKSIWAIPIYVLSALKGQVDKTAAAESGHLNFKHIA